jgi:hypothetical protein
MAHSNAGLFGQRMALRLDLEESMATDDTAALGLQLRNTMPIIGGMRRRAACRKLAEAPTAAAVPHLAWALAHADAQTSGPADAVLRALRDPDARDALCELAIADPAGAVGRLCLEARFRPSDRDRASLFLFVTRQLDAFFAEDPDMAALRLEYDRSDPAVQARVREVVRSGDRRTQGFFGARKPLEKCTDDEVRLAVESAARHQDWERLFGFFTRLPLRLGWSVLDRFRGSGWTPKDPGQAGMLSRSLEVAAASKPADLEAPDGTSNVFGKWMRDGESKELTALSEGELVNRLKAADPRQGVALAAAIAKKAKPGTPAARAVLESPHWLVRLAGSAAGLSQDLAAEGAADPNYWVEELGPARRVMDLWPSQATPEHLAQLDSARREAWVGELGAARRILRELLVYRISTPEMEPIIIDTEDAVVLEEDK